MSSIHFGAWRSSAWHTEVVGFGSMSWSDSLEIRSSAMVCQGQFYGREMQEPKPTVRIWSGPEGLRQNSGITKHNGPLPSQFQRWCVATFQVPSTEQKYLRQRRPSHLIYNQNKTISSSPHVRSVIGVLEQTHIIPYNMYIWICLKMRDPFRDACLRGIIRGYDSGYDSWVWFVGMIRGPWVGVSHVWLFTHT